MQELAEIINAPVLTTGTFQGAKGPPVIADESTLDRIIRGSNAMRPYILEAQQTGEFRGNPGLAKKLGKAIPAYININHESPDTDRIREALRGVDVNFEKQFILNPETGEIQPWIVEDFEDVEPLAAEFIRRYFPKRSIELLPMTHPETGEFFEDGVIISTAFLDRATPPAVPGQSEQLLVEFAALEESPLITVTTQQPMEVHTMAENTTQPADVSELQKEKDTLAQEKETLAAELKARDDAIELARKDAEKKEAEVAELKQRLDSRDIKESLSELQGIFEIDGGHYRASKSFLDLVSPAEKDGIIELAEGDSVKSMREKLELMKNIVELSAKGSLTVRLDSVGEKSYKREGDAPKSDAEKVSELAAKEGISKQEAFVKVLNQRYGGTKNE